MRPFLPAIVSPLLDMVRKAEEAENPPHRTSLRNLEFLLERILADEEMPEDKANRWIGFVQGVLAARGILNVDAERNATRQVFHAYYASIGVKRPESAELETENPPAPRAQPSGTVGIEGR